MNFKSLLRFLVVVVVIEILYLFLKSNILWSTFFSTHPTFCTTFHNDSTKCTLDYEEHTTLFLQRYQQFCEQNFVLKTSISALPACPCVPDSIRHENADEVILYEVDKEGIHSPKNCMARQTVAIIIPFRNRRSHLYSLLKVLLPLLENQQLAYQIFVVEQKKPNIFNKAMLMNAGFLEVLKIFGEFDCFIFHDVDMIPLDRRNFYACVDIPRHLGGFIQIYDFKLLYNGLFGGVTAFRKDQFQLLNGFSNQYYGWGGEDDDMLQRVRASNMMVNRFPQTVSRYSMIRHPPDSGNPGNDNRNMGYVYDPKRYRFDGLNSVNYSTESIKRRTNYTKILISLPEPPDSVKTYDRTNNTRTDIHDLMQWFILFTLVIVVALFVIYQSGKL